MQTNKSPIIKHAARSILIQNNIHNAKVFLKPRSAPRIIRYVTGVHMALAHNGLRIQAKKLGLNPDILENGEFIVFMNGPHTAFKMLAANNVLVYYRHPKEHRIDPRIISLIPKVFDGKELDMDKALKEVIEVDFQKKG